MKKVLILFTLWTTLLTANTIETYKNSKFSFSIDYPSDIFVNKIYEYNDSIALSNKEENVKLFVIASAVSLSMSAKGVYQDETCLTPQRASYANEDIEVTYESQKDNWFVFSGYNHTKKTIFYTKGFVYRKEEKNLLYAFEYPIKEKKKYEKLIKIFNKSFLYEKNYK